MLYNTDIQDLELLHRGKVRDIYAVGDDHLLIITTDRLSAFDVILPDPIPGKGAVLTATSNFWFKQLSSIVPSHIADLSVSDVISDPAQLASIDSQAIVVKKLKALPIEAIVRGYIIGSGWKDYQNTGSICGNKLPKGLQLAEKLPDPLYTPSTKAAVGDHDENVDFDYTVKLLGESVATQIRDISLQLYKQAAEYALTRGIIIADTKFEFGLDNDGIVTLIDEALTPDSSRFWPADQYKAGMSPPSFDKQFVRDYLDTLDWDKQSPGPALPTEIINKTAEKYQEALTRLTQ
ncbi:Phosphoribosylaminoimidazole-succinocarboxamide synthase [hydrothermal vent metagenome]|uniref:phosphoribosylaminoimidazolesuccinocarboxamide synthase n=1 Tax=hydrothermal vent metagenome TaxID=652676 RepID=A0A3B0YEX6_9ZZZZ